MFRLVQRAIGGAEKTLGRARLRAAESCSADTQSDVRHASAHLKRASGRAEIVSKTADIG
jgi:hypothetical protein